MITLNYLAEIRNLKNEIIELAYIKNKVKLMEYVGKCKRKYNQEYRIKLYVFKWYKWQLFKRSKIKDILL